jgi:hypothetical protein
MKIETIIIITENGERRQLKPYEGLPRCYHVEWTFGGVLNQFTCDKAKGQLFIPILSPSFQEIILMCKNFPEYLPPCNLVVLNGNGTVRHLLCPPELISEKYKDFELKVGKQAAYATRTFLQPDFLESTAKKLVLWIGFDFDCYEVREFDLVTGIFGKCIRSARL